VVADCLNHHVTSGLPARVAVGFELVAELVSFGGQAFDIARQRPESLLDPRLVCPSRVEQLKVMAMPMYRL